MNKKIFIFVLVFFILLYFSVETFVQTSIAQTNTVGKNNVNIPKGKPPGEFIRNIYIFFLSISGMLAFFVFILGGVQRVINAGNPEKIKDADEWIKSALWGLLLLFGAWLFLNTINPKLVELDLPSLQEIKVEEPSEKTSTSTSSKSSAKRKTATCQDTSNCKDSPALTSVLNCLKSSGVNIKFITYQGTHSFGSCHFGGKIKSCQEEGSRAFDMGFNALKNANIDPKKAFDQAIKCGPDTNNYVECYYEDEGGTRRSNSNFVGANHIHCNVNNGPCNCK